MKVLWVGFLSVVPLFAQPARITFDPAATKINFTLGDVLHTVHGTFQLTKGEILFDPETGKASGLLIVSANSGNSGSHARDNRMNRNVLQTDAYPDIRFIPDHIDGKVNLSGDSVFLLHGLFAIHGATHELTANVKSHIEGGRVTATADFDVPYVTWGMKDPSTLFLRVNNAVKVEVAAVGREE